MYDDTLNIYGEPGDYLVLQQQRRPKNYWALMGRYPTLEAATAKALSLRTPKELRRFKSQSGYTGVFPVRYSGKYKATILLGTRAVYLGTFATKELAAYAYNQYIMQHSLKKNLNELPPDFSPPSRIPS